MCIGLPNNDSEHADLSTSSEERKTTGRMVALIGALMLLGLAMYHAWIRKTAVLAGVIVPAAIMILYAAWVVFLTKRDKKRFLKANQELQSQSSATDGSLKEVVTTATSPATAIIVDLTPQTMINEQHRHHGHRSRRKHERFMKIKRELIEQQRQMRSLKLDPINMGLHRSKSVS